MSAFTHGMNADAVRSEAGRIDSIANDLGSLEAGIAKTVDQLGTQWHGPDLERFRGWWNDQHRPALMRAREAIAGLAQSARNNAEEQERASGGGTSGGGTSGGGMRDHLVMPTPDGGSFDGSRTFIPEGRSRQDAQRRYDEWAAGADPRFRDPNQSQYQCTGWANFRWHELGYRGHPPIDGHGGAMAENAPGPLSDVPSLHAMGSYGRGVDGAEGHVMIVEEVSADGSKIRISEMNYDGLNSGPEGFRDTKWIPRDERGVFRSHRGEPINFAAFPG